MPTKRMLIQTQLSNYDTNGRFILECDSGWQMCINRAREMLKHSDDLEITIMGPLPGQVITNHFNINHDLWSKYGLLSPLRLKYLSHKIIPNALATRYDFDWEDQACILSLKEQKAGTQPKWDYMYINDPMLLRNYKALFHVVGGYQPKFFVHSHFVDVPSCPKFPEQASLWLGQVEAALKADWNFWQCESALKEFQHEADNLLKWLEVDKILEKSSPWDDGYSIEEITSPVNMKNVRFHPSIFQTWRDEGKAVIFVPNRIGGKGRSSDYTNCGKFMFDVLPQLRQNGRDYVVLAGNPSQKFLNNELESMCGKDGYVSLVPDAFTRDEYKFVARNSDIAAGFYSEDTFGGTASRECVELGCMPLWLDVNEYKSIVDEAGVRDVLPPIAPDFSDIIEKTSQLICDVLVNPGKLDTIRPVIQDVVRKRSAFEHTTVEAMKIMGIL